MTKPMTKETATFNEYLTAIDEIFRVQAGYELSFTQQTGPDSWREPYDKGLPAQEAAENEISHWEDDT